MSQALHASECWTPKLFIPPEEPPHGPGIIGGGLSPRMTLSQFFWEWFLPVVLQGETPAKQKTILAYQDAIGWWVRLTGDPPLEEIDAACLAKFAAALRAATWQRSRFGVPRPLKVFTIAKHMRSLRSILARTGPTLDPDRPAAEVLARSPRPRLVRTKGQHVKPPIPIDDCRRIFAATDKMTSPALTHCTPGDFWRATLAAFYYRGLRCGEALAATPGHLVKEPAGHWFDLPGDITKTGEPFRGFCHPHAAELLLRARTVDRLLPWRHCRRWLIVQHERLQKLAGIERPYSPHAWRRTHGTQVWIAGADATDAARRALGHSDDSTTRGHYVDVDMLLILRLPRLDS